MALAYALIADIVGSRFLADRSTAQEQFSEAFTRAARSLDLRLAPYPTVGDEFQSAADDLTSVLTLTLRTQLFLPQGLRLRFGIGRGNVTTIDADRGLFDGSAWWAARDAINDLHTRQDATQPYLYTWFHAADEANDATAPPQALVNSYLLLRDGALARLQPRQRRILAAVLDGQPQTDIAAAEGMSQQAISQFVRGSGAPLLESQRMLETLGIRPSPSKDPQ